MCCFSLLGGLDRKDGSMWELHEGTRPAEGAVGRL